MPPEAPRFGAGFFVPDGVGVDSLEEDFDSVSSLTFSAGAGLEGAGLAEAGFGLTGSVAMTEGLGAALRRSRRRTYALRIGPRLLVSSEAAVPSESFETSASSCMSFEAVST